MNKLTDESPMPWGKHKGKQMADVPASYLMWLWNINNQDPQIRAYIRSNWDAIQKGIKEQKSTDDIRLFNNQFPVDLDMI